MNDKQLEAKVAKLRKEYDVLIGRTAAKEKEITPPIRSHNRLLDSVFSAHDANNNAIDLWRI